MEDSWLEISCDVPADLAETLATYLGELSGNGVCTENLTVDAFSPDEIVHPSLVTIKAYFTSSDDIQARLAEISTFLRNLAAEHPGAGISPPRLDTVRTEDWSSSWKDNFKPLRVGHRLLIVPSWEQVSPRPDDIVLHLDPGMAFGTGGHETTRLCLELLEEIMDTMPTLQIPDVLDLGTGSGILAMAASKLGAGRVCAVDIDPQAVEVAKENLTVNDLADQIECSTTPLEAIEGTFDVILANILAEELVRLAPQLLVHLEAGGKLVLSGILAEKETLVREGFDRYPLQYRETRRQGEWIALLYVRSTDE